MQAASIIKNYYYTIQCSKLIKNIHGVYKKGYSVIFPYTVI